MRLIAVLVTIVRVAVERNEMHAGANVTALQLLNVLRPADAKGGLTQAHRVKMIDMPPVRQLHRTVKGVKLSKRLIVAPGNRPAAVDETLQAAQLMQAERGLYVGHVVLVSRLQHL